MKVLMLRAMRFLVLSWLLVSASAAETHWAFVIPAEAEIPAVAEWAQSPVDAFLSEEPSGCPQPNQLMRRLSLNLRG